MIWGVTGCSGTGASTVAAVWEKLGASVCSLDRVGHGFLEKTCVKEALQSRLSIQGLSEMPADAIRRKLRECTFGNPLILAGLNDIMHPRLRRWVTSSAEIVRATRGVFVLDAALIFELGLEHIPDYLVTVTDQQERVIERLMRRDGITVETAIGRWSSQISLKGKSSGSHFVIDNSGTVEMLRKRAEDFYTGVIKRMEDANWHIEPEKS